MKIEILVWRDASGRWWAEGSSSADLVSSRSALAEWVAECVSDGPVAEFLITAEIPDPEPRPDPVRVEGVVSTS